MLSALWVGSLFLAAPAAAGEPVVFPDVTPGSTSDFALAFMLQEKVLVALERDGHLVLTADAARPVVGGALDQCADQPGCPFAALQQLPADVAVVVRVSRADGAVHGEVSVFDSGGTKPLEVRHYIIEPGAENAFAREIAKLTEEVLSLRSPASAGERAAAQALVQAASAPPVVTAPTTAPAPVPTPDVPGPAPATPKPPPARDYATLTFEERLADTGVEPRHILGSKRHFMKSNLDPRDWLFKSRSHAGRVVIDVRGGYSFGDSDRAADVRVVLDEEGGNASEWLQEGPRPGNRVRAGLFVGYAPTTWMDFGVLLGLQYSQKYLTTGWRAEGGPARPSNEADPVAALMIDLQARVRFYPAPVGVAKPFLLVGGDLRIFDAFHIIDPAHPFVPSTRLDYPDPPGGLIPGVTGGGGLLIDPGTVVGFFVEGTYTHHLGLRAGPAELGAKPSDAPTPAEPTGYTIGVVGGVQFRI